MRDFLCKVYDKLYCFLGYVDMRLILVYESGGKGCAWISFYIWGLRPLFPWAIGEVVALVALLSGIALSPELLGRYGRRSKNRDPVSVLRVRTSRSLASLPTPASHALDPLASYCYVLP